MGTNYLDVYRRNLQTNDPSVLVPHGGIESVLDGSKEELSFEYRWVLSAEERRE